MPECVHTSVQGPDDSSLSQPVTWPLGAPRDWPLCGKKGVMRACPPRQGSRGQRFLEFFLHSSLPENGLQVLPGCGSPD